ncbi:MAG TPA: helix-turn-helix domain-containing protein [Terriglobales bacterium]|nr:helix-turn-helix domain-containing protein [Terriglobales bacterium]
MPVSEAGEASERPSFDRDIERLALLEDPVRRALFKHLVRQGDYVSRDEAAAAVGIARGLAAFHLDKLVEGGVLEVMYRRLEGRVGPGAGRPSKLYRRSRQEASVSIPTRDYQLLAELLASSLDAGVPEDVSRLEQAGRRTGAALAAEARRLAGRRPSRRRLVEVGLEVLWQHGFEPRSNDGKVTLRNCPFKAVAYVHRDLVCPMNLALMETFVTGLNVTGVSLVCVPGDVGCCVSMRLDA